MCWREILHGISSVFALPISRFVLTLEVTYIYDELNQINQWINPDFPPDRSDLKSSLVQISFFRSPNDIKLPRVAYRYFVNACESNKAYARWTKPINTPYPGAGARSLAHPNTRSKDQCEHRPGVLVYQAFRDQQPTAALYCLTTSCDNDMSNASRHIGE